MMGKGFSHYMLNKHWRNLTRYLLFIQQEQTNLS